MNIDDTSNIKMNYYDQNNKLITDSAFVMEYSIISGKGHFVNQTPNTVQFVGDSIGTAKLQCSIRNLTFSISISILGFPAGLETDKTSGINVYPNPFKESFLIDIPATISGTLKASLFDTNGRLCRIESQHIGKSTGRNKYF
jgi:hypothetical protein